MRDEHNAENNGNNRKLGEKLVGRNWDPIALKVKEKSINERK